MALSHLATLAATMNPGTWSVVCQQNDGSNYGNPIWPPSLINDTGAGYRIYEFGHAICYDHHRQRIFYTGGAHLPSNEVNGWRKDYGQIIWDIQTNHWSALPIPDWVINLGNQNYHPYGLLTYHGAERVAVTAAANTCQYWKCNIDVDDVSTITPASWREGPVFEPYRNHNGRGWHRPFPERDSLVRYVPDVGVIQEIKHTEAQWKTLYTPSPGWVVEGGGSAYSPVHKKFMFGGGYKGIGSAITDYEFRFWIMDASGNPTVTANLPNLGASPYIGPYPYIGGYSLFWNDPASGDFLFLSTNQNWTAWLFWKYDCVTNVWTRLNSLEAAVPPDIGAPQDATHTQYDPFCCLVAPLPDHGVTAFVGPKVYLYKHATNTDAGGLSYARKTALQPGLVGAYNFDQASNVRTFPAGAYPMRYTNVTGACIPVLGTNFTYDYSVRGAGEANAQAVSYAAHGCVYPEIDNVTYNALGGGTGALKIRIPSQTGENPGGAFDTPYQGVDNPKINLAPHNRGRVWYQMSTRTHNVTAANLYPSMFNDIGEVQGIGAKIVIGGSIPPFQMGTDFQCAADLITDISKNTVITGYSYWMDAGGGHLMGFERGSLVQNAVNCVYTGLSAPSYVNPPCVMHVNDTWQQITWHFEFVAIPGFTVSGNVLSKTGFFTAIPQAWWLRWVYIQDDGSGNAGYWKIWDKIDNNSVSLTRLEGSLGGAPPVAGSGRSVVISSYPNSIAEVWVDGLKIINLTDQRIHWDGSDITTQVPGGFGQLRIIPHMTGKNATVAHAEATYWYDDLIIATDPISMSQSATVPVVGGSPTPCLPWFLRS